MGKGNVLAGSQNPQGVKRVHFKAPTPLIEAFDVKHDNRTEALVTLIRQDLDRPEPVEDREPLTPPNDDDRLARAYELLWNEAGDRGWIHEEDAKQLLSERLGIKQKQVYGRVIKKLRERGYLARISDALEGGSFASLFIRANRPSGDDDE